MAAASLYFNIDFLHMQQEPVPGINKARRCPSQYFR